MKSRRVMTLPVLPCSLLLDVFNPLYAGNSLTGPLAKSGDPDEMPQKVTFHLCLHFL